MLRTKVHSIFRRQLCCCTVGVSLRQLHAVERALTRTCCHVGCGPEDLQHIYEFHPHFTALPCFVCASALPATSLLPLSDILPHYDEVVQASRPALGNTEAPSCLVCASVPPAISLLPLSEHLAML